MPRDCVHGARIVRLERSHLDTSLPSPYVNVGIYNDQLVLLLPESVALMQQTFATGNDEALASSPKRAANDEFLLRRAFVC